MVIIDKSTPIPKTTNTGAPEKYPFSKMKDGESFLWKCQKSDINRIRSSILTTAKGRGFTIKTAAEKTGLRVWKLG